ncbi:MAG: N-6 DNA methylase, partial [bacterium]|nr:N-6 DNA methylase [bacterium]
MRKTKTGSVRMPSPYGAATWKTERAAVGVIMHYMRQIIEDRQIDLGLPDVDTSGTDRKSPDIIIYESRRSKNVLCVIEAKPPYYDASDHDEMYIPAWQKANSRKAKYFATTNFRDLIWFSTEAANSLEPELQQIKNRIHLSELEDLDRIEESRYKQPLQTQLEVFLKELYEVATGKKAEPKFPVDEYLIWRIHDKILRLSKYMTGLIDDSIHKDSKFASQLGRWFNDQGWDFTGQSSDIDKTARQAAYLLVNKIIFYEALRAKRPEQLDPLQIPDGLTKGSLLQGTLQNYFNQVLKIDYNTVYTTDFIDNIAFTDSLQAVEVIKEIHDLLKILRKYDFTSLGYDIIGRIFERLIPADERHALGQYFTNPDVVDIIHVFCIRKEKDKLFDPSCGAGTFLVRAYQQKKLLNQYLTHE